jgi:Bifunctional DNA primase/polymerase, N-terminal
MTNNLDAALRLAAAGLATFPCDPNPRPHPRSKRPQVNWTTQATTTAAAVRYFFSGRFAGAVPGIHLGRAGLVVLDLDVGHEDDKDGVAEFDLILDYYGGSLDGVPIVQTASGGYHLYFRQPAGRAPLGNREGMLAGFGINVRGDGGYVIGPGAVMNTGEFYECVDGWLDLCEAFAAGTIPEIAAWLVELIEWQPEPNLSDGGPTQGSPEATEAEEIRFRKWAAGVLRITAERLAAQSSGRRNNSLNSGAITIAGYAVRGNISRGEARAALAAACMQNGYIPEHGVDAFEATFKSGWDAGLAKPLRNGPRERFVDVPIIKLTRKAA